MKSKTVKSVKDGEENKCIIIILFLSFHTTGTRMHSSRILTTRSSSRRGRRVGELVLIPLNFPLGCGPGSDPPEFPPWVWAWI